MQSKDEKRMRMKSSDETSDLEKLRLPDGMVATVPKKLPSTEII